MAIQIIGAPRSSEAEASPLPTVDANVPQPSTVPAGAPIFSDEQLRGLLDHADPVIRSYAVEQASRRPDEAWSIAIQAKLSDSSPVVAADAAQALERRKYLPAVDALGERFKQGEGSAVLAAAHALGELAPERLIELIGQRGRLDDEAYAVTASAMAILSSPEVVEYLERALNRAGALSGERRSALYSAALRSGHAGLAGRVVALAVSDSKQNAPEGSVFPSRAALLVTAGVMAEMATPKAGPQLFDLGRELFDDIAQHLEGDARTALEDAVRRKNARDILGALQPVLSLPEPNDEAAARAGIFRRRRGLLSALIERRDEIGALEFPQSVVFVVAAAEATIAVAVGGASEAHSPALQAIAKALESNVDAARLAAMSDAELVALFKEKSERQMRRVHNILTHERTNRVDTFERFARAVVDAGHGAGLFEAAADAEGDRVQDIVIQAIIKQPETAEALVVEALTRTPIEPKIAKLALRAAQEVRTTRVALAIARRFYEFRTTARDPTIGAIMRLGDARFIPFLESRSYDNEPEEITLEVLRTLHGQGTPGGLASLLQRRASEADPRIVLPLACKHCKETLVYGFERVLIDPESKEPNGDPAFVGDPTCKACRRDDGLELTPEAAELLTREMLQLLAAARMGRPLSGAVVMPAQTRLHGKPVGYAAALRGLDKEVRESPSSIRARLERAELRLLLQRAKVEEDLEAVLAIDPRALEARVLHLATALRKNDLEAAVQRAVAGLSALAENASPRLYVSDNVQALRDRLEDLAYDCVVRGATLPAEFDLSRARLRHEQRLAEIRAAQVEAELEREVAEREAAEPEARPAAPASPDFKNVGRNDDCPCGSGKKFKRCHGKR